MKHHQNRSRLYAWITIFLWSSAYIATKIGLRYFTPFSLSVFRYLATGIVVTLFMAVRREKLPPLKDVPLFILLGLTGYTLYVLTYNAGAGTVSVAAASVIISSTPIFTALLAGLIFREKITGGQILATAVEFAGVLIVCLWNGIGDVGSGLIWIILSMCCFTAYNLLERAAVKKYTPRETTLYSLLAAFLMFILMTPAAWRETSHVEPAGVISVLYAGIFCSLAAYYLWGKALEEAQQTGDVTNTLFAEPVITGLMGFVILGEIPDRGTVIGAVVIFAGMYLFEKSKKAI
ncbi:MAG: DMT family transporter [Lachnospiraceae bacterium]|nr:DMT family transporter [Lachnospiraceae bacterium]